MCTNNINYSLICAVREGNLERVRELVSRFGLSYCKGWSDGFTLLLDAFKNEHTEVARLLLLNGCKVNSKNKKPSNTPLHLGVINGDIEIVRLLLNSGAFVEARNEDGRTPLHVAVDYMKVEVTELLMQRCAAVFATDNNGRSPLHLAVERKCLEIVEILLNCGANVHSKDNVGRSPVNVASEKGCLEIVEFLLKYGADVNTRDCLGVQPIHNAVHTGCLEIVELILNHGAEFNSKCAPVWERGYNSSLYYDRDRFGLILRGGANIGNEGKDGITPLQIAAMRGHIQIIELLLKRGVSVKDNSMALYFATQNKHEKVVKLLLDHGADVDIQDKDGKTLLNFAVETGHSLIIEHILKYHPELNNESNRSCLSVAIHGYGSQYEIIVNSLLQYGFNLRRNEDVNNSELFHKAIEKGYLEVVEDFLKNDNDFNILNNLSETGFTPLHSAVKNRWEKIVILLINCGADVKAKDRFGNTPIFYAIENNDLTITNLLISNGAEIKDSELLNTDLQKNSREIVEVLLQHGADVNATDKFGRKALYNLCKTHKNDKINIEIVELLLSKGAHVNAKQKDGKTALHIATENGHRDVIEVLLNGGAEVDSKDKEDVTPLHIAVKRGYLGIVATLLEYGSDVNVANKKKETPLFYTELCRSFSGKINYTYDHDDDYYYPRYDTIFHEFVWDDISELLTQQIVKMKTANLYVSINNLKLIDFKDGMSHFEQECREEIKNMKMKISNSSVSFHDILIKNVSQISHYARNENIVEAFKSNDYKTKFPIYASMIKNSFKKGMERKDLLQEISIGNLNFLFKRFPELPYNCSEKIISYLSNEDLKILVSICELLMD